MKEHPAAKQNYISRLTASFIKLWNSKDDLSFKKVRLSHLQYFLALPLSLTFMNIQELVFKSDVQLMGLDGKTIAISAYCVGAGLLFALANAGNINAIARVSVILSLAGFIPWLYMADGTVGLFLASLFMFGMGGSVACAVFTFTFVLNNPERFLGAVMLSLFYAMVKLNTGLSISPLLNMAFMYLLIAGTVVCLAMFKTADFNGLSGKSKARLNPPIMLVLYFFIAGYCVDYFYYYLPGTAEPKAMVLSGLSGLLAVCLAVVVQIATKRSVWHMCNLFFIAMICGYALYFAPEGSFLRDAAIFLHGFQLIGYTVMFYLLGCVFKKHGDFRLFKLCLVAVMLGSVLTYIIPDTISKQAPALMLPVATITSGAIFAVFILLSPAYARHLFSADWSEDFRRLDMTGAEKKVVVLNQLENLNLTPREKEIAAFLLRGMTARQIASQLGISPNTANFHIKNLYKKLGITGRPELFLRFGAKA